MTLLEGLKNATSKCLGIAGARMIFFAISDRGDIAFLSEVSLEELVPALETWCAEQRKTIKVH